MDGKVSSYRSFLLSALYPVMPLHLGNVVSSDKCEEHGEYESADKGGRATITQPA